MQGIQRLQIAERRAQLGIVAAVAAVLAGAGAALLSSEGGGLVRAVEGWSATAQSALGGLTGALPLSYAFVLGMFAAFNPCGFALLPTYLGFYLGDGAEAGGDRTAAATLLRALTVSLAVTAGFVVLFGLVGLALSLVTSAVADLFPLVGLLVGVGLAVLGGRMIGGATVHAGLADRLASRMGSSAREVSLRGYLAYGVAYGAASLGCTLPLFLIVVVFPLTQGGVASGALQFLLYALGMGAVITALTLTIAFVKRAAVRRAGRLGRWVQAASPAFLLVAGGYLIYYWLTAGRLIEAIRGA